MLKHGLRTASRRLAATGPLTHASIYEYFLFWFIQYYSIYKVFKIGNLKVTFKINRYFLYFCVDLLLNRPYRFFTFDPMASFPCLLVLARQASA